MPRVFGISRVRDEDDVIEYSLRRMCAQVDHVLIGEGNSTDETRQIIESLIREGLPITLLDDTALNFQQRDVMTAYAQIALRMGGEWACFYDTDEAWFADGGRIADVLPGLSEHVLILPTPNLTHSATDEDDLADPDPMSRMGWRGVGIAPLHKVACRLRDDLQVGHGNHSAIYERERHPAEVRGVLESRHFPYRTPEQLIKRVRIAYPMLKASGLPRSHGLHMWEMGEHWEEYGDDGLRRWFANGMFKPDPSNNPELCFDPIPPLSSPGEAEDASTESVLGST